MSEWYSIKRSCHLSYISTVLAILFPASMCIKQIQAELIIEI